MAANLSGEPGADFIREAMEERPLPMEDVERLHKKSERVNVDPLLEREVNGADRVVIVRLVDRAIEEVRLYGFDFPSMEWTLLQEWPRDELEKGVHDKWVHVWTEQIDVLLLVGSEGGWA